MPAATELAAIPLKPNVTIEDASSSDGQQFKKFLGLVAAQKGFQRQYWGRKLEERNVLIWSVDWDDIGDHHTFMQAPAYKECFEILAPFVDLETAKPFVLHANFASHPPNEPRDAPVTEFAFFTLPTAATNEQKSALEDAILNLSKGATTDGSCTGFATGWIVEDLDHEKGTDGKAIGLQALLGWPSKDEHMRFREEKAFAEAAKSVRGIALPPVPGHRGTTFYHAALVKG